MTDFNILSDVFSSQEEHTLVSPLCAHHPHLLVPVRHKLTERLLAAMLRNPLSKHPRPSRGSPAEGLGRVLPHPSLTCTRPRAIFSSNFTLDSLQLNFHVLQSTKAPFSKPSEGSRLEKAGQGNDGPACSHDVSGEGRQTINERIHQGRRY